MVLTVSPQQDTVVSVAHCRDIFSVLTSIEAKAEMREYVGADRDGHWIKAPEQVDDMAEFLTHVLHLD
jgi:lysophospholipase II